MSCIKINNKSECSGCSACSQICPQKCISMEYDSEGFLYPKINEENCTNCRLCKKTCPVKNLNIFNNKFNPPIALGGGYNNIDIKMQSSSGGVFSAVAELVLNDDGVVFGAAFDADIHLKHTMIEDILDLDKLRRSKYIQSEIGYTYIEAKKELDKDREVLYVGTPCQIAGLKAFLVKDYDNLISIDIVCHGVPSPKVFKDYIINVEKKYNSKISYLNFRDKRMGWNSGIATNVSFFNAKEYFVIGAKDSFINGFLSDIYLRPSCYDCKFSKLPRIADISLADFWGVSNYYPSLDDGKGTSLILINNGKGKLVIEKCKDKMTLKQVDLQLAVKHNPCIEGPVKQNPRREHFFKDYNKNGWRYVEKKYLGPPSFIKRLMFLPIRCLRYVRRRVFKRLI